jgi:precorrin-8X/cobalt-precorrin-8 methylmutase
VSGPLIHPIEDESYRIMRSRVDFSHLPAGARHVVERMVHATADESFSESALVGERFVEAAVEALGTGAAVVCDSRMVLAGVPGVARRAAVHCYLDRVGQDSVSRGSTRSAESIVLAADEHPDGAVWVIGNAPTALARLLELQQAGRVRPSAVIGLPVGYVGAADAKAALWDSPLRPISVTNVGRRGGSPVAAAALNAVSRLAWPEPGGDDQTEPR